jgi:hypothetical protein
MLRKGKKKTEGAVIERKEGRAEKNGESKSMVRNPERTSQELENSRVDVWRRCPSGTRMEGRV